MREAEGLNFSVGINGEGSGGRSPKPIIFRDIVEFIKGKNLLAEQEKKLIEYARKIPSGSLGNFKKNYRIYLNKVLK
jgi:hypothetical protein